jgi:hypothetical protein
MAACVSASRYLILFLFELDGDQRRHRGDIPDFPRVPQDLKEQRPDVFLLLGRFGDEDSRIAEGIKEREHKLGISDRPIIRIAGPDCGTKRLTTGEEGRGRARPRCSGTKGLCCGRETPAGR